MRTFVSILAVLLVATGVVLWLERGRQPAAEVASTNTPAPATPPTAAPPASLAAANGPPAKPVEPNLDRATPAAADDAASNPITASPALQTTATAAAEAPAQRPSELDQALGTAPSTPASAAATPAATPADTSGATPSPTPAVAMDKPAAIATPNPTNKLLPPSPPPIAAPAAQPPAPQPSPTQAPAPAPAATPASAPATAAAPAGAAPANNGDASYTLGPPAEIADDKDGWKRVDGRFLLKGAGTEADPYTLPWDILVSASESYRPRLGKKELPQRVTMLKGKKVRMTGYVLFPLMTAQATELLLMRNQWDGCCIGVPPTPYDAIEVKLAQPADRKDMFVSFVSIEGTLDVDPYMNKDWLLGLYTMSGATLSQPTKGNSNDKGL